MSSSSKPDTLFHGLVNEKMNSKESGGTMVRLRSPKVSVSDPVALDRLQKLGINVCKGKGPRPYAMVTGGPSGVTYPHLMPRTRTSDLPMVSCSFSGPGRSWAPTAYQQELATLLSPANRLRKRRFLVYWSMGSGKTYGVLYALRDCPKLVVICPLTLVRSAWLPTLSAIRQDDAAPEQVVEMMGPDEAKCRDPSYYRDKIVVIDEVHVLRNSTDLMEPLFRGLRGARVLVGLSGTPLVHSVQEADYLFELLQDPGPGGKDRVPWVRERIASGKMADVSKALAEVADGKVHYYSAVSSLPEIVTKAVEIAMTPYQTMRYLVGIRTIFQVGDCSYQSALTKNTYRSYEKQVCNCVESLDATTTRHCPKIDACVKSILQKALQEGEARQAVYCHFIDYQMKPLLERLLPTKEVEVHAIRGDTSMKDRERIIKTYNQGGSKPVVLVFSDAANLGMSLKRTSTLHVMDIPDNQATFLQVVYRGARKDSHLKGEKLHVRVYVATFSNMMRWDKAVADRVAQEFRTLRKCARDDGWTTRHFLDALEEARQSIPGGMTVEQFKWKDMNAKADAIQPLLDVLQKAAPRPIAAHTTAAAASSKASSKKSSSSKPRSRSSSLTGSSRKTIYIKPYTDKA